MTPQDRTLLKWHLSAALIFVLFVPWTDPDLHVLNWGYHFIFMPPSKVAVISYGQVLIELVGVSCIAGLIWLIKRKKVQTNPEPLKEIPLCSNQNAPQQSADSEYNRLLENIQKLKEQAIELRLPNAISEIFNAVHYSPKWATECELKFKEDKTIVRFRYKDKPYCFQATTLDPSTLTLLDEAGNKIFAVSGVWDFGSSEYQGYPWIDVSMTEASDIQAFVPGDWVKDILEMATLVATDLEEIKQRWGLDERTRFELLKKDFGLK